MARARKGVRMDNVSVGISRTRDSYSDPFGGSGRHYGYHPGEVRFEYKVVHRPLIRSLAVAFLGAALLAAYLIA